jgi:hypothetical protein
VLEVADILRAAGAEVCARLAVSPSQQRAVRAILECRTPALGGEVFGCPKCGAFHYSYHSCGNRNCTKCHGQQTERWLTEQRARLLACPYYLLTFTLPAQLRYLACRRPALVYGILLKAAAASVQKLCADPQWLGAQPSLLGVLHTWTRMMLLHPHAHFLVSAGGLSADGQHWLRPKNPKFLVPVRALSVMFRAKVLDALQQAGCPVPKELWQNHKKWVVHAQHAGSGQKVLDYLGRYVFRIAITHSRLEQLENGHVTFRYRDNKTQQLRRVRVSVQEFVRRFLQHVLPKGLPKVRHYGLGSSACRSRHAQALALLQKEPPPSQPPALSAAPLTQAAPPQATPLCPHCGLARLVRLGELPRLRSGLRWLSQLLPSKKIPP